MKHVLVVGASRGIGLEFVRQYTKDGFKVFATCRQPADAERLTELGATVHTLDVRDTEAIAGLGWKLDGQPLDVVIINAGLMGPRESHCENPPNREQFDEVMHTNVLAPMQLLPAIAPSVLAAHGRIAFLSSTMGSIGTAVGANALLYRASKAALNMVARTTALNYASRDVIAFALHPGWVRTDMGGAGADVDVRVSVTGMRDVIARANKRHNGAFLDYRGQRLEW